jgi:hypothetical protein
MTAGPMVKAMLTTTDAGAAAINFQFNPTELQFQRSVSLNRSAGARTASGLPKVTFAYPEPVSLSLSNLTFDTYEAGTSVLTLIDPIIKSTDYVFAWGQNQYLKCFVKSVSYKLTMFLADGTPVRAIVDMSLEEVDATQL